MRALGATNDKVAAADAFSRAVDLEPSNASYRVNLGLVYEEIGRPAEAIAQYRERLKIDARNMPVLNVLAKLLSTSSDSTIRDGTEAVRWAGAPAQHDGGTTGIPPVPRHLTR